MPSLPRLPDGTTVYPGMATLTTLAGTFVHDRISDGVLRFYAQVPTDAWGALTVIGLDERGQQRWRPWARLPIDYSDKHRAWAVATTHDLYIMGVACSSRRVEVRITVESEAYDRTFAGPWLKAGWTLSRPVKFAAGADLSRILVRAQRPRARHQGEPVAIDLSYLFVRLPDEPPEAKK